MAPQREQQRTKERALSNVPRGQARASVRAGTSGTRLGRPANESAKERASRIPLAGITVRRALLRDSSGTIPSDAARASRIEKTTMVHYARALRSALAQPQTPRRVPLILRGPLRSL